MYLISSTALTSLSVPQMIATKGHISYYSSTVLSHMFLDFSFLFSSLFHILMGFSVFPCSHVTYIAMTSFPTFCIHCYVAGFICITLWVNIILLKTGSRNINCFDNLLRRNYWLIRKHDNHTFNDRIAYIGHYLPNTLHKGWTCCLLRRRHRNTYN